MDLTKIIEDKWIEILTLIFSFLAVVLTIFFYYLNKKEAKPSFNVTGYKNNQLGSPDVLKIFNKSSKNVVIEGVEIYSVNKSTLVEKDMVTGKEGELLNIHLPPQNSYDFYLIHFDLKKDYNYFIIFYLVGNTKPIRCNIDFNI
ncbi:TPA: hypothetical protein JRX02_002933 [Elizabethkingia anophelis]|uniref:hypothetical protein n=1 Tax=Elizabethkingia anophelis TaxID=1117645 RepID=UPI0021A5BFDB|nr:hypothetical protein [Elizabethkingia anophelis]MCT4054967.1 hypothetical protein [Elizabethkingia anophelis]HAY3504307.1 hypothetical protein [Elizabethkingia anophelis]HAY3512284.1 hypothetical protein [Elizabethkingia anophelis]HAY3516536.1 hypothetical protein [Elizabethkingia anophelis]